MRLRRIAALASLFLAAGCAGDVEPFQGLPRPRAVPNDQPGERIGICYNSFFTTTEKVSSLAAEACGRDAVPQLVRQDMRLNCPLLTPVRATFLCVSQ